MVIFYIMYMVNFSIWPEKIDQFGYRSNKTIFISVQSSCDNNTKILW